MCTYSFTPATLRMGGNLAQKLSGGRVSLVSGTRIWNKPVWPHSPCLPYSKPRSGKPRSLETLLLCHSVSLGLFSGCWGRGWTAHSQKLCPLTLTENFCQALL